MMSSYDYLVIRTIMLLLSCQNLWLDLQQQFWFIIGQHTAIITIMLYSLMCYCYRAASFGLICCSTWRGSCATCGSITKPPRTTRYKKVLTPYKREMAAAWRLWQKSAWIQATMGRDRGDNRADGWHDAMGDEAIGDDGVVRRDRRMRRIGGTRAGPTRHGQAWRTGGCCNIGQQTNN